MPSPKTQTIIITLSIISIILFFFIYFNLKREQQPSTPKYTKNTQLKTIINDTHWKGNPVDQQGNFLNLNFPYTPKISNLIKWMLQSNPQKKQKKEDKWSIPIINDTSWIHSQQNSIVWLGHATFFIRINNIKIITDPIFSNPPFIKRITPFPINPNILPSINYILISHDHRDHCDKESISLLLKKNPNLKILAGLKMDALFLEWNKSTKTQTAGWYQQFDTDTTKIKIYFLPARHWSKRGMFDDNQTLWGSFVISSHNKNIYFSGDTGYDSHFQKIGQLFPIDYAIIGIGAYKPQWIMSSSHISPQEAIQACKDMKAKICIPMHYGTFDLSDEPNSDPYNTIKKYQKYQNIKILNISEKLLITE